MNTLTVGSDQQYSTIAAAIADAQSGDTIQVTAGTYTNDFANINADITLEGVGGIVNMVCTEEIPNGKGIFVTNGNITISNFSFSGAQVDPSDNNGAGIRYESGNLVLNNDSFFNNENGLLGGVDPSGSITINSCEFANNGVSDPDMAGYGGTHNLYVGEVGTLTIDNSYFHDANIGHEIKSRALNTVITNSRIQDGPTGTASYSIDLPNGGNVLIQNNVIQQGPLSENSIIIAIGEEGSVYENTRIQIAGNQILNDLSSASVLAVYNQTNATAQITDNQFWGLQPDQIAAGPNTQSTNQFLDNEPSLDTTSLLNTAASVDLQSTLPLLTGDIAVQPSTAIATAADPQIATSGSEGANWQDSVPDGYQIVAVGGSSDILLPNPTTGDVAELRSDNGMTFSDIGLADPGSEVAGATDPNGDGTPDIVFDFPGSGAVGAFMMNDGHATLTPLSSTPTDGAKQA
jgi:hypothetical protein